MKTPPLKNKNIIFVKQIDSGCNYFRKLFLKDIIFMESGRDYISISYMGPENIILDIKVHMQLNRMLEYLSDDFIQVHKSYIVNVEKIKSIEHWNIIYFDLGKRHVPISNKYRHLLKRQINVAERK